MDELQRYGLLSIACAIVLALTFTFRDREAEAPLKPKQIHEKRDIAMAFEGGDDTGRQLGASGDDVTASQPRVAASDAGTEPKHPGVLAQHPSDNSNEVGKTVPVKGSSEPKKETAGKPEANPKVADSGKSQAPPSKPEGAAANEYTVAAGDTLTKIARAKLGDGKRWPEIVAVNPNVNKNDLKPGVRLKLPSSKQAAAGSSTGDPKATPEKIAKGDKPEKAPAVAADTKKTGDPKAKTSAIAKKHTVAAGETLSTIARQHYNDAMAWQKIFNANKAKMKSPTDIHKGMVLTLP